MVRAGELLDALGSAADEVWPGDRWPPMRLEGAPAVGVRGAHGPVRYVVSEYLPGRRLAFTFTSPQGFYGGHAFEVVPDGDGVWFGHTLELTPVGWARVAWPLAFGPLHDALAADAIVRARRAVGEAVEQARGSAWVRLLRLGG